MKNIKSRLFNIFELIVIIIIGLSMKVPVQQIICLLIVFMVVRQNLNNPMHYKSQYLCLFWSTAVFISFYILTYVNPIVAMLGAGFGALVVTGNADVKDVFMFNNDDESKYREMKKFIENNQNTDTVKEYEKIVKNLNERYKNRYKIDFYKVFVLKFYEKKTFKQIIEETNLNDNKEVTKALDIISMSFNTFMQVKNKLEEIDNDEKTG